MEITAALSSAKTAFTLARALYDGLARQQIKAEEVPARLMELQQHILSMQAIIHDLSEENRQLHRKVEESDVLRRLENDVDFYTNGRFLVRKSELAGGKVIPYCPVCWGLNRKLVVLPEVVV